MNIALQREPEEQCGTRGILMDDKLDPLCFTIERTDMIIPSGTYRMTKFNSPSKGAVFLLHDVVGRTMIEMHIANKQSELLGCIAVGLGKSDDGITHSADALHKLYGLFPDELYIDIRDAA